MGTTQPIREKDDLKKFLDYYQHYRPNARNYALIIFGLHTALRIGDILNLKWEEVYDFDEKCFREHLFIREKKTGKQNIVAMNCHLKETLNVYKKSRKPKPTDYIFTKTTDYTRPLSRLPGFPNHEKSRCGNAAHHPCKLPLPSQNLWLPRMETRRSACTFDGHFQPFFLHHYKKISGD